MSENNLISREGLTSDYDLHCHSHCSDGTLAPTEVVARAAANGVKVLAITDHDQTTAFALAKSAATQHGIQLVPGVEISTRWLHHDIHILGLGIDPDNAALQAGLAGIREQRHTRAAAIAAKLAQCGIPHALTGAREFSGEFVGRLHFAKFLIANGYSMSIQAAFDHYLAKGKKAYVSIDWVPMAEAIGWIHEAGGLSVVAHPLRYRLKFKQVRGLLNAFKKAGGDGVEVISGNMPQDSINLMADTANKLELLASCGSDFHGPDISWTDLGQIKAIPTACRPVWHDVRFNR